MNTETTDLTFQDWLEIRNRKLSRDMEPDRNALSKYDPPMFISGKKAMLASDDGKFFDITYFEWLKKMDRKLSWFEMVPIWLAVYGCHDPEITRRQLAWGMITPLDARMRLWAWEHEHPNVLKKKKGRPVKVASR